MEEKRIEIPCNKKVKDYTINNLKKLCGLTVSRAYEQFIEKGTLSVEGSTAPDNRIEQLIKLINRFTIPKSVPVRPVDKRHMEQFRERWKKYLESLPVNNAADSKPVYLTDAVNKILKRRKSHIQCTRIHLMWHLDLQGEDHMIPEEIATAITKFGLSDWSDVRPLVENSKYNIRISGNGTKEIEQEEFLKAIEFIYQIPNNHVDEDMMKKILNDIKVLQDFLKDNKEAPKTYDYEAVWEKYTAKLQTAPASRKRKSEAKQKVKTAKEEKAGESSKECENTMTEEITVSSTQTQEGVTGGQEESPVIEQTPPADEDPGEEPEHFSPEEVEVINDELYKGNYEKLLKFLNEKASSGLPYMSYLRKNINENGKYIRGFAYRPDFDNVYNTLVVNANRPGVSDTNIIQFIRNVARHNILEWGAPAPR